MFNLTSLILYLNHTKLTLFESYKIDFIDIIFEAYKIKPHIIHD